jgi:hypothetical protein
MWAAKFPPDATDAGCNFVSKLPNARRSFSVCLFQWLTRTHNIHSRFNEFGNVILFLEIMEPLPAIIIVRI